MKTFEDLGIYQLSFDISLKIYSIQNSEFKRDYGFKDQIQRASVSIMNNIAEGFERSSNKDFIKFLYYSKGSVGEVRSLLNLAVNLKYIEEEFYNHLRTECISLSKQISGFIKYLNQKL